MKQPKLYRYLASISESEWKEFLRYIQIYYLSDSKPNRVLKFLYKHRSSLPAINEIISKVLPQNSSKDISNQFSLIQKKLEVFFVNQNARSKTNDQINLMEGLLKRGLFKDANDVYKSIKKNLLERSKYDKESYLLLHKIEHMMFFSGSSSKYINGLKFLQGSKDALNTYSRLVAKQLEIESRYRREQMSYEYDELTTSSSQFVVLDLRYDELNQVLFDNKSMDLLIERHSKLEVENKSEDISFTLLRLINHERRYSAVEKKYNNERLAKLYMLALKHNLFSFRGTLPSFVFLNIIDTLCTVYDKSEKARIVWERYKGKVNKLEMNETEKLCFAHFAFYESNFQEALDHLINFSSKNVQNVLREKWFRVMCLYELERMSELEDSISAYRTYLRNHRKDVSEYMLSGIRNFLKITIRLIKNKPKEEILKEFNNLANVNKGSWLIKKIKVTPS